MTSYEQNLRAMICVVEDQIVSKIESGNFSVRLVIEFLNKHIHDNNRIIQSSVARIVRAVKDAGFNVRNDTNRYYIYR